MSVMTYTRTPITSKNVKKSQYIGALAHTRQAGDGGATKPKRTVAESGYISGTLEKG